MTSTVTLAILARDMGFCLPEYLACIEAFDYPKDLIHLQVRTNDNRDDTKDILDDWLDRVCDQYRSYQYDCSSIDAGADHGHLWSERNLSRIAFVRNQSLSRFLSEPDPSDYYFALDVDNFLTNPKTLGELVRRGEDICAPMLSVLPHEGSYYSNFFADVNEYGYYKESPEYLPILFRKVRGTILLPVVHCTYLVRRAVIPKLSYSDDTKHYDFVCFSRSAREHGIRQVLLNEEHYGYLLHGLAESREEEPNVYRQRCRDKILAAIGKKL